MNVGRYLRGEDRHVGTARTKSQQAPKEKCRVCGSSGQVEQYTSARSARGGLSGSWCPTPEGCGPHGCHGACLPKDSDAQTEPQPDSRGQAREGFYRKKPVVIEAYQLPAAGEDVPESFHLWCERVGFTDWTSERDETLSINTLEGEMTAQPGDWIIKGVKGEFYPCKPDIFAATYDPAASPSPDEQRAQAAQEGVDWKLTDKQCDDAIREAGFAFVGPRDAAMLRGLCRAAIRAALAGRQQL